MRRGIKRWKVFGTQIICSSLQDLAEMSPVKFSGRVDSPLLLGKKSRDGVPLTLGCPAWFTSHRMQLLSRSCLWAFRDGGYSVSWVGIFAFIWTMPSFSKEGRKGDGNWNLRWEKWKDKERGQEKKSAKLICFHYSSFYFILQFSPA